MEDFNEFMVVCVHPTATTTQGNTYRVFGINMWGEYLLYNDNGRAINIGGWRFNKMQGAGIMANEDVNIKEMKKEHVEKGNVQPKVVLELECVDNGTFKNLTKGKMYIKQGGTAEMFTVENDAGVIRRYAAKYFKRNEIMFEDQAKKKEVKEKNVKKHPAGAQVIRCIHPRDGITFAVEYAVVKEEESHYTIKDDNGKTQRILKTRFKKV